MANGGKVVHEAAFTASCLDSAASPKAEPGCDQFLCQQCPLPHPAFASNKALMSRCRAEHGARNAIIEHIGDTGVCPNCSTNFITRLRLIADSSDSRRARCRVQVMSGGYPKTPPNELARLNEADREIRKLALESGHTHPIATKSARTAAGKRIGHVRA